MPVTEINKKLQEQHQGQQQQQQQTPHQQQQPQQQQQQISRNDELDSTSSLVDSLTTQQQQEQLFHKLQQLQQQKDKNFVSDDEFHKFTDKSTTFYATNLHDQNTTHLHTQLASDDDQCLYSITKQYNTSCPIISSKSSTSTQPPSSSSNNNNNDNNPLSNATTTSSTSSASDDTLLHNKLSINQQTKKRYSLDYFDQFKSITDETTNNNNNNNRIPTFNSMYLQPNSQFIGEQQSGKSSFHIKVEFKTVDLFNSVVTGFLQISGLTDANSEITTYFKGEIINNPLHAYKWKNDNESEGCYNSYEEPSVQRYSFITENKQWGSFAKNDFEHWKKLTQSTTFLSDDKLIKRLEKVQRGEEDDQYIYMRWKEEFLLPDSRIKQITGASFEGFYYIVLNIGGYKNSGANNNNKYNGLLPGGISGLYYHKSSEKFQSLSLRHVENHIDCGTFDFV